MRVWALVESTQVLWGGTRARNGERGPEARRVRTVTSCAVGPGLNTSMEELPPGISTLSGMAHSCWGCGDPGTMARPEPSALNSSSSLATTRPMRVVTVVAMLGCSCTYTPTLSTWV